MLRRNYVAYFINRIYHFCPFHSNRKFRNSKFCVRMLITRLLLEKLVCRMHIYEVFNNAISSEEGSIIRVIGITCICMAIKLHPISNKVLRWKKRRIRSFIVSCRGTRWLTATWKILWIRQCIVVREMRNYSKCYSS